MMLPFTVKLLVALVCFTAVYLSTEAADTCPATTAPCIPGPPGRDGKDGQPGHDGQPGRDGRDGVPGTIGSLTYAEGQQLKEEILETIRGEISMLNCSKTPTPQCRGTTEGNPATSCREVYQCNPTAPSGYYWIRYVAGSTVQVFCLMNTTNCGDITGGWMRAAYINMRDPANSCPRGLITYYQNSTRICSSSISSSGCTSVNFPTYGVPFTKVCGRALGYQYGHTDAFNSGSSSINSNYVEGLSVTHGVPRSHIWTFASAPSKNNSYGSNNCPCAADPGRTAPSFVGENYFCESGNTGTYSSQWYLDDPLWDSQGCASGSTCCNRGGPWFTTTLDHTVSNDIEVRWCTDYTGEESGVEQLEIYIN